jgi:hypothetical protein
MTENRRSVIIVNITWNPYDWRDTYVNHQAGHKYTPCSTAAVEPKG